MRPNSIFIEEIIAKIISEKYQHGDLNQEESEMLVNYGCDNYHFTGFDVTSEIEYILESNEIDLDGDLSPPFILQDAENGFNLKLELFRLKQDPAHPVNQVVQWVAISKMFCQILTIEGEVTLIEKYWGRTNHMNLYIEDPIMPIIFANILNRKYTNV